MYAKLTPFVSGESVFALFDLLENRAYQVLYGYLDSHNWHDEGQRLKESRFIGTGTYRLLTLISLEHLYDSPEQLVVFYERCKRPKDDPHYEDLITTALLSVVLGIIANFCYDT